MEFNPNSDRILRGTLLRMIYVNHQRQGPRTNSVLLHSVLREEGYGYSEHQVLTILQDLGDRGYLRSQQQRKPDGSVFIFNIELTFRGRDLMDGRAEDAAVQTD